MPTKLRRIFCLLCSVHLSSSFVQEENNNVQESEKPVFVQPPQNVTVSLGRDAQLTCVVDRLGSYKAAWIQVESKAILSIHDRVITRNYRIHLSYSDNRNFILHIRNVQKSDQGGYMCQINTVPMDSRVGYLEVLVPPDFEPEESKSDVVAVEGANVTLRCRAKGYPKPTVSWRREDEQPIAGGSRGKKPFSHVGETLNITRVSRVHNGAYLCIASNEVPPAVSRRILLHVHFPPVMWIPNQMVGAPLSENVTVECYVEAHPLATTHWLNQQDVPININERFSTSRRETGYKIHTQLVIRNLRRKDFGIYKCFAKNTLGATENSVKLYEISLPMKESAKTNVEQLDRNTENLSAFQRNQVTDNLLPPNKNDMEDSSEGTSQTKPSDMVIFLDMCLILKILAPS